MIHGRLFVLTLVSLICLLFVLIFIVSIFSDKKYNHHDNKIYYYYKLGFNDKLNSNKIRKKYINSNDCYISVSYYIGFSDGKFHVRGNKKTIIEKVRKILD